MSFTITKIKILNFFNKPPTNNVKIGIELVRSGFQFTLWQKSLQELIRLWHNGHFLSYDDEISDKMTFYFKLQTGFDILDFLYACWKDKSDITTLIHHSLIIFLCSYYGLRKKLAEGIMILGAMSNQLSGIGFNTFKILALTKQHKYTKKLFTGTSILVLLSQIFYRIPVLFYIGTYSIKYTKDKKTMNKWIFFILLQLYNEYDWIKWSIGLFGFKQNKFINHKSLFLFSILFSYLSAKKFYTKLENYKQIHIKQQNDKLICL